MIYDPTKQYYVYQADCTFTATAIGSTAQGTFRVTDTPFICTAILAVCRTIANGRQPAAADDDGAGEIAGPSDVPVTLQIEETGSDRVLSNVEVDGYIYAVIGRYRPLPVARMFRQASTVTVKATMRKALNSAGIVRVCFEGFLDYAAQVR